MLSLISSSLLLLMFNVLGRSSSSPLHILERSHGQINERAVHSAAEVIDATINAIGGDTILNSITGLNYRSANIFRSHTLTQSYNLYHVDQSVVEGGSQNISLSFMDNGNLKQRIDRRYKYDDYWIWAFPSLSPDIDYTFILEDGETAFACFTHGSNSFYSEDPMVASGYADPYLTDYLVQQSHQFSLIWLLKRMLFDVANVKSSTYTDSITGKAYQRLIHDESGLQLLVDPMTYLPSIIRSLEDHKLFGPSTSDLVLSNYSSVPFASSLPQGNTKLSHNVALPHRYQTIYNSEHVLEDFLVDEIRVNPTFPTDWFEPLPRTTSEHTASKPTGSLEYPRSEIHEFFETGLWMGPVEETVDYNSTVVAQHPLPSLEQVWTIYLGAYPDYVQLVVDFVDGVLVTDAPPHRSKNILRWIQENLGKQVKWVVPSHHHRDHAGGIGDYAALGASIVVPEIARKFYEGVNNKTTNIITFSEESPFVLKDLDVQFTSIWRDEAPHSRDWIYSIVNKACPDSRSNDTAVVYTVDVINPGSGPGTRWDLGYARQWSRWALKDRLPRDAVLVGSHGGSENGSTISTLQESMEIMGVDYPDFKVEDFMTNGSSCSQQ